MRPKTFVDARGQPVQLGAEIGKGGEGSVFEVAGRPSLVAKIYHRTPLPPESAEKLEAVVSCWSEDLNAIAAWPTSVLYQRSGRQACGLLMPKIASPRHLHELYGTYNRRRLFPDVRWHHLVLAARNLAAAFDTVHAAGIVVGDVNQGNLLIDQGMCVRFIDCDSFQLKHNGKLFHCPVGTPHFTPPELQSMRLREVPRTAEHDRFGLAILIFHMLFVGRHPFAGRYRGEEELTIEKAIAERRFAFSKDKDETEVDPPPASLLLDDLPAALAELFEAAFRSRENGNGRPTAMEWVKQLEALIQRRKVCSFDESHVYFDAIEKCPWCRIEDEGGPAFFYLDNAETDIDASRHAGLQKRIRDIKIPKFPSLARSRLRLPALPANKNEGARPKLTASDAAAATLVLSVVLCLLGAAAFWPPAQLWSLGAVVAGSILAAAAGGFLLVSPQARFRRKHLAELSANVEQLRKQLQQWGRAITALHRKREAEFDNELAEVKQDLKHYKAEGVQLQDVLVVQRSSQKSRFLSEHLIRDHYTRIRGLNPSTVAMLESFGVESAYDVEKWKLRGIPIMTPSLSMELLNWREEMDGGYTFKPEHGVTLEDVKSKGEAAVNRFRISQARKILMAAKQLDVLVDGARYEMERAFKKFVDLAAHWKDLSIELGEYQSGRRPLEKKLNRSATLIAGITLGAPLVGTALYGLARWLG